MLEIALLSSVEVLKGDDVVVALVYTTFCIRSMRKPRITIGNRFMSFSENMITITKINDCGAKNIAKDLSYQ